MRYIWTFKSVNFGLFCDWGGRYALKRLSGRAIFA
jgi:hypothetical protein